MNLRSGPSGHGLGSRTSPRLALGCAQLGNLYRARSEEEAAAILEEAWNAGIRQFDTAPHYGLGLSERRLGAFLRGNVALLSAPPPGALWDELRERGLIKDDAPVPRSPGR